MSYHDQPKEHWESALKEIEKKEYFKQEAQDEYARGMIKNGELFIIKGAEAEKEKELWVCAVFMNGKLFFAKYSKKDKRLETLKMKAVSHLMEIVQRGWADTRQAPWLPPRVQNIKNPDIVIHGAKSNQRMEKVINDGSEKIVTKDEEEIVDELKDVGQL